MSDLSRRALRNAQLDTLFVGRTYRIAQTINLLAGVPAHLHATVEKFTTVVGSRGYNGFALVETDSNGNDMPNAFIVGAETLRDADARGAVTNMAAARTSRGGASKVAPTTGNSLADLLGKLGISPADAPKRIDAPKSSAVSVKK